jgi:hypothetical protein
MWSIRQKKVDPFGSLGLLVLMYMISYFYERLVVTLMKNEEETK